MQYTITEHYTKYHPERLKYSHSADIKSLNDGIIVKIKLNYPNLIKKLMVNQSYYLLWIN